jgi:pilus retraction protein PilT
VQDIENLCQACLELGAADLLLREYSVPFVRVGEDIRPLESPPVEPVLMDCLWSSCGAEQNAKDLDSSYVTETGTRFRVNLHRQLGLRAAIMRRIETKIPSMEDLGLPVELLRKWLIRPSGLILFTGATGTGKSTTMAACLNWLNHHHHYHIITIEDPVEYLFTDELSHFTQREVGPDTPSFAEGLRRALRQTPDVILLGEIRDSLSATTALQAAETGHLVLASLHSSSATETVERLNRIFPSNEREDASALLSAQLVGIFTQMLLPGIEKKLVLVAEHFENQAATRQWIRQGGGTELTDFLNRGGNPENRSMTVNLVTAVRSGKVTEQAAISMAPNVDEFRRAIRGIGGSASARI